MKISLFTEGLIDRAQVFVWPFLLGLREVSLAVMGGLFTATNLLRTVMCLALGKSLDKHSSWVRLIQSLGMIVMSISFFIRGFFFNIFFAGIGQALGGVGHTVYAHANSCKHVQKSTANKPHDTHRRA